MFGLNKPVRSWRRAGAILFTVALAATAIIPVSVAAAAHEKTEFSLVANNATILPCLSKDGETPTARVQVERGDLNDTMRIHLRNIKPNLAFDLFTIQRSNKLADGKPDPAFATTFKNSFGLAWYQTDLHADQDGNADVTIKTILLDQIFGFDPDVALAPTNTFHVGFWFNDPNDAAHCGFDVTHPTPFNGEHQAGPLAMISLPVAATTLGPLCLNPDTSVTPVHCNP
jgi:hypothetical protein